MLYKLFVALAAILHLQLPKPAFVAVVVDSSFELETIGEVPYDGLQSHVIPEQCPVPHFQEQCLGDEITRANAQRLSDQLDRDALPVVSSGGGSYTDKEIKLVHEHYNTLCCINSDVGAIERHGNHVRYMAARLFDSRATAEEKDRNLMYCLNSNARFGPECRGKKKLQQLARRDKYQFLRRIG